MIQGGMIPRITGADRPQCRLPRRAIKLKNGMIDVVQTTAGKNPLACAKTHPRARLGRRRVS